MEISKWYMEICRGGATLYIMSAIVVFSIKDEINYQTMVNLSKKLVEYCLKKI